MGSFMEVITCTRLQLSHCAADGEDDKRLPLQPFQFSTKKQSHQETGGKNLQIICHLKSNATELPDDVEHAVVTDEVTGSRNGKSEKTLPIECRSFGANISAKELGRDGDDAL